MNVIERKQKDTSRNEFYGVDINDKAAVEKEYQRLQKRHRKITILVIIVLAILGIIGFDFFRVNSVGGKPIFALSKKVDRGTLFTGLGYKVLYCENGDRYIGSVLYKTCEEPDMYTFKTIVYDKLVTYTEKNQKLDKNNLTTLVINTIEKDEENEEGGSDYILDVSYKCNDGSSKCFQLAKEYNDTNNNHFYIRINKYNEIYDIVTFKDKGMYYDRLVADYTTKVKQYMIQEGKLNENNLRNFYVSLVSNNGKYKFRDHVYADSYLIKINYICSDNTNTCVTPFDKKDIDGDYANLSFLSSMFLDSSNTVALIGPKEYLEIE